MSFVNVMGDVARERKRQDEKWGKDHRPKDQVMMIVLVEEVGEVSRALLTPNTREYDVRHLREELVQVAAVAVRWVELIDRDHPRESEGR